MTDPRAPGWDTIRLASTLTFIGGFIDVVSFIGLFSLFAAQVTGTMVMIGVELAGEGKALTIKLLAVPVFVVTVAVTALAIRRLRPSIRPVLFLQMLLLLAFMLTARAVVTAQSGNDPATLFAGMLAVIALTMQTTATRMLYPSMLKTAVMTGNATQAIIMLVAFVDGAPQERATARALLREYGPAILAYMIGVTAGAFGFAHFSFGCVLLPAALLGILCLTPQPKAEE